MSKKKSKLQEAQEKAQEAINEINKVIEHLGEHSNDLCINLNEIQYIFDSIRNMPNQNRLEFEKLKTVRLTWEQQVKKIEKDYNDIVIKEVGAGVAGVGAGVAVVAMGPTIAMGMATTFGVASTGTAIASLSGAAATNAALAWLGGGALAVGGGGMAAGNAFMSLLGPIGWTIAGISILASGLMLWKASSEKSTVENIFVNISEREVKSYKLAIVELNERISRIEAENILLEEAITEVKSFGLDYNSMSEKQQYALGAYLNLMNSSTQLLVNPIQGLQPKYSDEDYERYLYSEERTVDKEFCNAFKNAIISLANFFYKIDLDSKAKILICKLLKNNKKMLESLDIKKKNFKIEIMDTVEEALVYKYSVSV